MRNKILVFGMFLLVLVSLGCTEGGQPPTQEEKTTTTTPTVEPTTETKEKVEETVKAVPTKISAISDFILLEEEEIIRARFSLIDDNFNQISEDGTCAIKIYDEYKNLLYSKTSAVSKSDFKKYTLILTGQPIFAYAWQIPTSEIKKGLSTYGAADLSFTAKNGQKFTAKNDFVAIPHYTDEEIKQMDDDKYLQTAKLVDETKTAGNFQVKVVRVGHYTYHKYGEEKTDYRIDLEVKNIASESDYFWESDVTLLDDIGNQYESTYGGTFEGGNLFPGVKRPGYLLFNDVSENANSIRIMVKAGYDENFNDIYIQFDVNIK